MTERDYAIVQLALPPYRTPFVKALKELNSDVRVLCGPTRRDQSVRTDPELSGIVQPVRNSYIAGRRLVYQRALRAALGAHVAVLDLNPRNLTTWLALVGRRLVGRPSVVWGHGSGRDGSSQPGRLRAIQMRLASLVIVYTDKEVADLELPVAAVSAGNGIYRRSDLVVLPAPPRDVAFVCSGRVVMEKEVELLVEAFDLLRKRCPEYSALLHIVGEGPETEALKLRCEELGLAAAVRWHGAIWDRSELADIYESCVGAVSPGYVGLNAVQALSFGRPLVWRTRCAVAHAPEVAILNEANSRECSGGARELSLAMESVVEERLDWLESSEAMIESVSAAYTADGMAEVFARSIRSLDAGSS